MKDNIDWNDCAPEILCMIFKYLDTNALAKCMLVNNKWRDIADHTAEHYKLWEEIVKKEMINKGTTFTNKSVLSWRNIYKNSLLWANVAKSNIKHLKTYDMKNVMKVNIYKENLILITGTHVIYYDIKTFTLIRSIESTCSNFEENDNIIVEHGECKDLSRSLNIYLKLNINHFNLDLSNRRVVPDVRLCRLEDTCCYMLTATNYVLYNIIRKGSSLELDPLGRFFGSDYDPITCIHVCNDLLYLVTKHGRVWYRNARTSSLYKVYHLPIPDAELVKQFNWILFDTYSCVVPMNTYKKQRVKINYDAKSDVAVLECSGLTCALQHGDVLLMGYEDGKVEIHIPSKNKYQDQCEPEFYFNIQEYSEHTGDSAIIDLNVCETINSHILLVSTKHHIFQLHLTYPESLL